MTNSSGPFVPNVWPAFTAATHESNVNGPVTCAYERPVPGGLRQVPVQRDGRDVVLGQSLHEPVCASLRSHEDERESALRLELFDQPLELVACGDCGEPMLDVSGSHFGQGLRLEA